MIQVKLPDGSVREFPDGTRVRDVAAAIGRRLARDAVAATVDSQVVDLDRVLPGNGPLELAILTPSSPDALRVMRHSAAHIMARAVMRLYPGAKLAFGPTIENGFYYDFDLPTAIREEDLPRIEEEMKRVLEKKEPFERFEMATAEARQFCAELGQTYKVEHIDVELRKYPTLSFYSQGEFVDLCRGPHVPDATKIGAFKLLSVAGAYWKNDASRKMLQRIYGTAWFSEQELKEHLHRVEEAKRRDHRVLGKQLGLFTISADVGPGLILWMPKGAIVRGTLETFIKDELLRRGYQPVYTPHIGRLELYRTSGHFPYYRDAQYPPLFMNAFSAFVDEWLAALQAGRLGEAEERARLEMARVKEVRLPGYEAAPDDAAKAAVLTRWMAEQEGYLVKPMNCPHHIQIYKASPRSYRDLPVRLAEFGTVYRLEQTGELSGMTRVRGFTQDDAHLFVTPEQVEAEMHSNLELVLFVLKSLGLEDYRVRVGLRDPKSDKYVGTSENWDKAQATLLGIVQALGMNHTAEEGEAAFYGPKVDFVVRDCIGREWQLGTVQLDYNLPERFGLEYVGADNRAHRPVMIHRAPFGSMERFVGILIEHFAGAFPLWLAPVQARVLAISERFADYARRVHGALTTAGFRAEADLRPEKIGHKIREAQLEKIPYMLVVGDKEQGAGTVAVRDRVDGDIGAMPLEAFLGQLKAEVAERRVRQVEKANAGLAPTRTEHEY